MGDGVQTAFPPGIYNVYSPAELVLLALVGLVIAVAGALAPAGWAARVRTATALRAELPAAWCWLAPVAVQVTRPG
jgi:putative ABC transport system permease protein